MTTREATIIDYQQILRSLSIPWLVLQPLEGDFLIVEASDSYLSIASRRREDLEGKTISEAFIRNPLQGRVDCERLLASFSQVVSTGQKKRIEQTRFDLPLAGQWAERYWTTENIPLFDHKGRVSLVLYTVQDITDRVVVEKRGKEVCQKLELKQQEQRYFIEENSDGLFSLDLKGNFTSANKGLSKITDLSVEELLKISFLPFCHPLDQELIVAHFKLSIDGEANTFDARFISAKGRELFLEIHLIPIRAEEKIIGAYGIAKDKTLLWKAEKMVTKKSNFLRANASFISSLLQGELEDATLEEAFSVIGQAVGVDRMYYFSVQRHSLTREVSISQKIEWVGQYASPQIENPAMRDIPARELHQLMGYLTRNKPFMAKYNELEECLLKEIFLEQEIKALLILPVFLKSELYGFIGFDDVRTERDWSEEEISFLRSLAHNLTTALEKRSAELSVKKKEEALRLREQKYKALVQEGSDMIGVLDEEGCFSFASDTYLKVLGYPSEELEGKQAFDFIHSEDVEEVKAQFYGLELLSEISIQAYRFRNKQGEWRWLETRATNLIKDPAVQGIVSNSRDVTKVVEQARELKQLHERYVLAATATRDLVYDWDLVTDEVFRFHRSLTDLYGFRPEEVGQRDFWRENIHPEDVGEVMHKLEEALRHRETEFVKTKYRFKRADEFYATVVDKGYIIRNSKGKAIRIVGAISDMTKMTEQKKALKAVNKRYKLAMKATNEVIWDWDIISETVTRSKSFMELYGYSAKNAVTTDFWFDKVVENDRQRVQNSIRMVMEDKSQRKWREEYDFIRADGEIRHLVDRAYISRDKSGKALRMVGAALDVTQSRQAFQEIKRQNELLRKIAWKQSHLVRTPLVRLMAQMYDLELEGTTIGMEGWKHLKASAQELDEIIREIVLHAEEVKSRVHPK